MHNDISQDAAGFNITFTTQWPTDFLSSFQEQYKMRRACRHRANLVWFLLGNREAPVIMVNFSSLVIAVALLVNLVDHSATFALPTNRMKDDTANQNSISAVMDDDAMNVAGPSGFSPRRFPLIEGRLADEDGIKKIFILSDLGSKGASGSDASSGFGRAFPVLSPWRIDRALAATQKDEWHDADDLIPMAKRNTDNKMLRCMIGRVYRPCWQA
ncbi:hypothetical protein HF521_007598 [Silurus meridionalis]|uniref:Melanin-concentrating hormone n=1 Tax=Silurus meridionalis TaxID=175797 RepID=A0A8T0APJ4_SILME|nr:hypothetical protein HF521_007598 [Silurus meridionalis]